MLRALSSLSVLVLATAPVAAEQPVKPLPQAHAHNDYRHPAPLIDALAEGFCSVEADVFCQANELLVAHDRVDIQPGRTLRRLYLDPLRRRVQANGGSVYGQAVQFTLLIDFKSSASETYPVLATILKNYQSMLVHDVNGQRQAGAVEVVLSGNRPTEAIANDPNRLCYIDGRLPDLNQPAHNWMPLISDRWTSHFSWRGKGPMPESERSKLRQIVQRTHSRHQRIRFWATPDLPQVWAALHRADVDLINTDDLAGLARFLRNAGL